MLKSAAADIDTYLATSNNWLSITFWRFQMFQISVDSDEDLITRLWVVAVNVRETLGTCENVHQSFAIRCLWHIWIFSVIVMSNKCLFSFPPHFLIFANFFSIVTPHCYTTVERFIWKRKKKKNICSDLKCNTFMK